MKKELILELDRHHCLLEYTMGTMYGNKKKLFNILENPVRDINKDGKFNAELGEIKVDGLTAIPYGTYIVKNTWSPKFKRKLPLVVGVNHFDGIRFHRGVRVEHTDGCLLTGLNTKKGELTQGKEMEEKLVKLIDSYGGTAKLIIK